MKKILLCLTLSSALFLMACNNTENTNQPNNEQSNSQIENNSPVAEYDNTDFSEKAGFKVILDDSLQDVKNESILLINETIAQLDLTFPDDTIGTLLVDSSNSSQLSVIDTVVFINDIKISIENGIDGINAYEWIKDNYTFTYYTSNDIKDSQILTNLVNGVSVEITNK